MSNSPCEGVARALLLPTSSSFFECTEGGRRQTPEKEALEDTGREMQHARTQDLMQCTTHRLVSPFPSLAFLSNDHPRHPSVSWCREGRGREPGTQSPGRGLVRYRN